MYSTYLSSIGSNGNFSLLVSGGNDYSNSGVMIKNDTTIGKGLGIRHSSDDNTTIDFRTQAGGSKSFTFRLQDDSSPSTSHNMLSLSDDNLSSSSNYAVQVGGRIKASQFHTNTADTRPVTSPGLYIGHDSSNKAYLKINRGTGIGGFAFRTYDSSGNLHKSHMELSEYGYVKLPQYSETNDTLDNEASAIASFDENGQLVRSYKQNARLRSVEDRTQSSEEVVYYKTPTLINSIIRRINSLEFFSTPISEISLGTPSSPYTVSASEVQISISTSLSTAQTSEWQTSFLTSISEASGVSSSSLSITSVSSSPLLTGATAGSGITFVVLRVTPSSNVEPKSVSEMIKDMAKDPNSLLASKLSTSFGSNPIDTSYTPRTRDVVINDSSTPTPAPMITARYIRFQYGNGNNGYGRALNLSEIKVYSSSTSSNIVTSSTTTTANDTLQGYPSSNLVDNNASTFYHSNGSSEYPWVQVDLGIDTPIYKVELRNRVDCCQARIAGLQLTLANTSGTVMYTSNKISLLNGSVTYIESANTALANEFYTFFPALSISAFGTNGSAAGSPTPAPTPMGQTIVRNYNDSDSNVNVYGQRFFIWTAPINCRIKSASVYASGGLNNGGFIVAKVFKTSNWTQIFSIAYSITRLQDNELPVSSWSSTTLSAGEPLIFQWTTLETWRYFQTKANATSELPVILTYEPL